MFELELRIFTHMSTKIWIAIVEESLDYLNVKDLIDLIILFLRNPSWYFRRYSGLNWKKIRLSSSLESDWKEWKTNKPKKSEEILTYSYLFDAKYSQVDFEEMKVYEWKWLKQQQLSVCHLIGEVKRTSDDILYYQWYWLNETNQQWIPISYYDDIKIENEWQKHRTKTRKAQVGYHCFGCGVNVRIDFEHMTTYCGDYGCELKNHNIYKIQRSPLDIISYEK